MGAGEGSERVADCGGTDRKQIDVTQFVVLVAVVVVLLVVCTDVVVTAIGSVCWTDDIAVAILWVRDADVIKALVGL